MFSCYSPRCVSFPVTFGSRCLVTQKPVPPLPSWCGLLPPPAVSLFLLPSGSGDWYRIASILPSPPGTFESRCLVSLNQIPPISLPPCGVDSPWSSLSPRCGVVWRGPGNLRLGLPLLLRGVVQLDVPAGAHSDQCSGLAADMWEGCRDRACKGRIFLSSYFVT